MGVSVVVTIVVGLLLLIVLLLILNKCSQMVQALQELRKQATQHDAHRTAQSGEQSKVLRDFVSALDTAFRAKAKSQIDALMDE